MPLSMAELSHVPKHPFSQRMWKLWLPSRSENLVITKSSSFFFSISDSVPISCNLSVIWLQWQPSPHNLQTEKFKQKFCIYLSVNDAVSMSFPLFSPFSWCQPLFRLLGISMNYWMQIHTYLVAERYTATFKDEVHLRTPHCGLFYQISDRIWSMYKPTIK